ncbi:two-component system response regulator YesN [Anaerotaenia torta]|uniref:response regulator transcription factor n=1 Tax=Anaerotaenia torta TaxID=433293 RepID=UPI003D23D574
MCKVIIVDDDPFLRKDLRLLIPWEEHGFELVGEASDGLGAMERMDEVQGVDIVITDICMPYGDGIELIRETMKKYPYTKCLVVSNYDDFKYVKEALKLGATDYILKFEIERDNLLALLLNTKRQIAYETQARLETIRMNRLSKLGEESLTVSFWRRYLWNASASTELLREAQELQLNITDSSYSMILVKLFSDEAENRKYVSQRLTSLKDSLEDYEEVFAENYLIEINPSQFVLLYKLTSNSTIMVFNAIYQISTNIYNKLIVNEKIEAALVMNEFGSPHTKLSEVYRNMEKVLVSCFYYDKNRIYTNRDILDLAERQDEKLTGRLLNSILKSLVNGQAEFCLNELKKLFDLFQEKLYDPELVYQVTGNLVERMKFALRETGVKLEDEKAALQPGAFHKLSQLYEGLKNFVLELLKQGQEALVHSNVRIEIKQAIEFISENYQSNITLEEVADHVGLSKNHFCRLFKNELQDNFISYINRYRIQKAKFLMEHTDRKIKEIAIDVGLSDYRYFCKIFKEEEKMTPTDYKRNCNKI